MPKRIILGGSSDISKEIRGKHISKEDCDVTNFYDVGDSITEYCPKEIVVCSGYIHPQPLDNASGEWAEELNVNLYGAFNVAINGGKKAKIVFIGSTSGLHGRAGWAGYCASKAGVISLVQSLAAEGHEAWCVSPGRVNTKMRRSLFPDEDPKTLLDPKEVAAVVEDCFKGKYKSGANIIIRRGHDLDIQY